jgi:hypothetical protein
LRGRPELRWLRKVLRAPLLPVYLKSHEIWTALRQAWREYRQEPLTRLRAGLRRVAGLALPRSAVDDTLFFFYDLHQHPVSYDVASQLVIAELERRARGLQQLHLVIVPGEWRLQKADGYDAAVPADSVATRIHQLALPIAQLLPSCRGVTLCTSRGEAEWMRFAVARHVYPPRYEPIFSERVVPLARGRAPGVAADAFFPMLRANASVREFVRAFLADRIGQRSAIVITLRQYGFMPERDSRVANWIAFADGLDPHRYAAVFVPDTAQAADGIDAGIRRHAVCELASWNVAVRMALYELAYLNISVMHGPLELALYNESCRYAVFIPVGASPQTTEQLLMERGFSIGHDLPFARRWQRIVWDADSLPAIRQTFAEFEAIIDDRDAEHPGRG